MEIQESLRRLRRQNEYGIMATWLARARDFT